MTMYVIFRSIYGGRLQCIVIIWQNICHAISYSGTPLNGHPSKVNTHNNYNESPDCPLIHFNTERTLNSGHRATSYNWQLSRSQLYANKENREKQWARDTNVTLSAKGGPTTPGSRTYQRSDGQRGVTA